MYRLVRVNTPNHKTEELAVSDMESIITAGFYWKKSQRPDIPIGTLLIAMGSHGGRGLYLVGIVTGEWENERYDGEYHHRLPVQWHPIIYKLARESVEQIGRQIIDFNIHSGSILSKGEFREALGTIMLGRVIDPYAVQAA